MVKLLVECNVDIGKEISYNVQIAVNWEQNIDT